MGVTGSLVGPIPSHHEYSALSVLIIVQHAPSLIISLFGSFGHSVAFKHFKIKLRLEVVFNY